MSKLVFSPDEGMLVWLGGMGAKYKLAGEDTNGSFAIVEHPVEPGTLVPPHTHSHEDEFSYVLEGEVGVRIGDQEFLATPGCYIVKPRGIPHTFWNAGKEPARLLEIISPAGFEQYFAEVAEVLQRGGPRDMGKMAEIADRYGITYEMSWVPELAAKYHLKPPR